MKTPETPLCPETPWNDRDCQCELIAAVEKRLRALIADDLREQAEVSRASVSGRHPSIQTGTHAAALRWAATRVEQ